MSNKLRSFITVLVSIVVVMAALPLNTLRVNADGYTITYSAGEGTGEQQTFNTEDGGSFTVKGIDELYFSHADHVFKCWQDGDSNVFKPGDSRNATKNINLTAQWVDAITITFDKNEPEGKEVTGTKISQVVGSGMSATLDSTDFECTGYEFLGWAKTADATTQEYTDGQSGIQFSSNDVLYAVWKKQIEVSFDSNGGSGSMDPEYLNQPGGSYNAPANAFTYNGFRFVDWRIGDDDSKHVNAGNSFNVDSDITLYATWQKYWTVSYYANGGEGAVVVDEVDDNSLYTAIAPALIGITKSGYEFAGWKDTNENKYSVGDTIPTTSNVSLNAQWERKITFHANGGTGSDTHQTIPVGSNSVALDANTFDAPEEGKIFVGWARTADGTIQYQDKGVVSITGVDSTDVKDLYAQWGKTCTVSFDANDSAYYGTADGSMSDAKVGIGFTTVLPAYVFTRAGHTFAGWEDPSVTGVKINADNSITIDSTYSGEPITLKAKWTPSTHAVTFKDDDGSVIASTTYNYGVVPTPAVPTKAPTKESVYTFDGWKDTSTENTVYKDGLPAVTGATTYQATYTASPRPYTVSVSVTDTAGGSVEASSTKNYGEEATITVELQDGYHIERWTITSGDSVLTEKTENVSYTFTVIGDTEVTVEIAKNPYIVTVTSSEGGTASAPTGLVYNDVAQLSATASEGYHFVNWTENGTEVSTDPEYTFTVTGARNLKANFAINMYTVTYKNDDGTILQEGEMSWGSTASYQHMANPTKKPTAQFTYTFAGWDNKETLVTKDITYTATYTYTVNKYKITFANEDGTVLQTGEIEYGKIPVYEKDTPTKAATVQETFTFAGWDKEISKVTGETVYTATYTSKPITKDSINYKYFTVAFVTNGGSEIVSQLVAEGGVAFKPEEPLRERYSFGGWYIDEALTKPFSFATAITSDITLYAKWIKGSPDIEATYAVVGLGSTSFELGSGEDITVAVERSKDNDSIATHFKGVLIDGVEVDYYNYELAEDNSSVIIRADALEGLDAGTHTITIVYDDGTAEVELVVTDANEPTAAVEKITETEAGDTEPVNFTAEKSSNWGLWIALGIVAVVVIAAIPIFIIKGRSLK